MKIFSANDFLRIEKERFEKMASELENARNIQDRISELMKVSNAEQVAKQLEKQARMVLSTFDATSQAGRLMGNNFSTLAVVIQREHERMKSFEVGISSQLQRTLEEIGSTVRILQTLPFTDIARSLRLSEKARQSFATEFLDVTVAYRDYISRIDTSTMKVVALPSKLIGMPAIGYNDELRFVTSISVPGRTGLHKPVNVTGRPFYERKNNTVREILGEIDPGLVVFWDEARKEGMSSSPAKGKYVCSALRTVMSEFLSALSSPVEAMKAHGDDPDIAATKGKGSRLKAQVRDIVGVDDPAFSSVIEEEVAFLMTCLHKGDHGVSNALALDIEHLYGIVGVTGTFIQMLFKFHEKKNKRRNK